MLRPVSPTELYTNDATVYTLACCYITGTQIFVTFHLCLYFTSSCFQNKVSNGSLFTEVNSRRNGQKVAPAALWGWSLNDSIVQVKLTILLCNYFRTLISGRLPALCVSDYVITNRAYMSSSRSRSQKLVSRLKYFRNGFHS